MLEALTTQLKIRFADPELEAEFQAHVRSRFYSLTHLSLALAALSYASFGVWDVLGIENGAPGLRFRFLVVLPVFAIFFFLSFREVAKRHSEGFILVLALTLSVLSVQQLRYFGDGPYGLASGSAALNFALIVIFLLMLFPLSAVMSAVAGVLVIVVYCVSVPLLSTFSMWGFLAYCFNLLEILVIAVGTCYWRERFVRAEYLSSRALERESERLAGFLAAYLPPSAIEAGARSTKMIADSFGEVTILFCDLVGFTALAEKMAPKHLVELLNDVFSRFDQAAEQLGVEKVKTIGDAYMAIAGARSTSTDHAAAMADFALNLVSITKRIAEESGLDIRVRIGLHSGALIGGVVGTTKTVYDYWGRTVNVASRLEATSETGRIQVSEATYLRLRAVFDLEERGRVQLKGIGELTTYFLLGRRTRDADAVSRGSESPPRSQ